MYETKNSYPVKLPRTDAFGLFCIKRELQYCSRHRCFNGPEFWKLCKGMPTSCMCLSVLAHNRSRAELPGKCTLGSNTDATPVSITVLLVTNNKTVMKMLHITTRRSSYCTRLICSRHCSPVLYGVTIQAQ